jgi:DNA segregation ATPase FtsK/SpoIIIE, S-DNA-T family
MSKKKKKTKKQKSNSVRFAPFLLPVQGWALLVLSIALFLSLLSFGYAHPGKNWLGLLGYNLGWFFHALLGLGSYVVCAFLAWAGWRLLFGKSINYLLVKVFFISLFTLSLCMLACLIEQHFPATGNQLRRLFYPALLDQKLRYHLGGALVYYIYNDLPALNMQRIFGTLGIALIFSGSLIASLIYLAKIHPRQFFSFLSEGLQSLAQLKAERKERRFVTAEILPAEIQEMDPLRMVKLRIPGTASSAPSENPAQALLPEMLAIQPETNLKIRPSISRKELSESTGSIPFAGDSKVQSKPPPLPKEPPQLKEPLQPKELKKLPSLRKRENALAAQQVHNGDFTSFVIPPDSLLTNPKKVDQNLLKKDLKKQAEVLEETLQSFGIEAKVGQINCGPTISSFEVHPAIGVKVQKIKALENDIALNMEAKSIRIIAPIPGKAAVGIEVPNPQPQEVAFKDLLLAYQQNSRKFHIPILLGKAVNGDNVMSDLAKMPHCIIAGATGSGKSVCINTIIMAILMNAKPDEVKFIMVDPKKVELTPYSKLPHMLAPVITEPQGACAALNWLVKEMEKRYEILKLTGTRNIDSFNNRKINQEAEAILDREIPEKMAYFVGIIDELADLMMVSSQDIETPIARIAQMARAVGIHLILATQRPSREVITGLIKANFPTRISFKVASRVNSQIILDETGAESLLGNGDMLFLPPGSSQLIRAQGAFIRDEDINAVIKHICEQAPPNYVIESFDRMERSSDSFKDDDDEGDSLYQNALDIILSTGNASTTFLQRKLKIGYARAASLIDMLESKGIVGPAEGSKPRKILAAKKGNMEDNDQQKEEDDDSPFDEQEEDEE